MHLQKGEENCSEEQFSQLSISRKGLPPHTACCCVDLICAREREQAVNVHGHLLGILPARIVSDGVVVPDSWVGVTEVPACLCSLCHGAVGWLLARVLPILPWACTCLCFHLGKCIPRVLLPSS